MPGSQRWFASAGGKLFARTDPHRSCAGALTYLRSASTPEPGRDHRRFEVGRSVLERLRVRRLSTMSVSAPTRRGPDPSSPSCSHRRVRLSAAHLARSLTRPPLCMTRSCASDPFRRPPGLRRQDIFKEGMIRCLGSRARGGTGRWAIVRSHTVRRSLLRLRPSHVREPLGRRPAPRPRDCERERR